MDTTADSWWHSFFDDTYADFGLTPQGEQAETTRQRDVDFLIDAFDFVPSEPCDAAVNWFTSFGYDRDDRVNSRMLARAFEALRPGGRFALDTIGLSQVLAGFRTSLVARKPYGAGEELLVIQEPRIDFALGMFQTAWTLVFPDGRRQMHRSENRAYMPHELVRLVGEAGFGDVRLVGSSAGEPFERTSSRCIVVGVKPA